MRHIWLATLGIAPALLTVLAFGSQPVLGQEPIDPATSQYVAAMQLQNRGSYDQAEQAWAKFLKQFKSDPRAGKATHNLGVCHYQQKKYDQAIATFQSVIQAYPQLEALDATYLYLGVSQYTEAQNNKPALYDAAIATFQTLITQYPQGRFVPEAQFYRAECLYSRGKKTEAIEAYRQFVANYPDDKRLADVLYALGVAQEEQGQAEDAAATYDAFLRKFPKSPLTVEVGMRRGETSFAVGQYDDAAKRFAAAAVAEGFAHADYALLRQADSLARLKQHAEAAALYASLAEKFPKSKLLGRALLAGGKSYQQAGTPAEARKLFEQVLPAGGPDAVEAAHWLAKIALKGNQAQTALTAVEKVLAQADKSPYAAQVLMDHADALYELPERRKESIDAYAAVATRYPKAPVAAQALYMAGFAALEQGACEAALKHANAFLAAHPKHDLVPDVMHVAAESQLLMGKVAEADKRYAELLEEHPAHSNAAMWKIRRGLALVLQKKHQEAIGLLQPALTSLHWPALTAEAHYLIGTSQLELKQEAEGIQSLEASLAADPKWRQADETLLALAAAYHRKNDLAKAKATLQKLIAEFPASPMLDKAWFRLGELGYISGDYPAAAAAYRQVVDKSPQSPLAPQALHELGCAELAQKEPAAAEKTLDRLLQEFPKHPLAVRARYTRGMARYQQAKHALAVEDLQTLLKAAPQAPEQADARYVLGLAQMGLKQYDAAQATFQSLLDQKPPYGGADNALYQLAWAQKLSVSDQRAVKTFAELAQKHADSPHAAEALYHVGEAAYQNKDYPKAVEAYYAVLQKAGKSELSEKAGHKLAWTYYHQGDFARAEQTFHFQETTYPDGPLAADGELMVAECLFKQNKYQEALDAFEKLKRSATPDFQALALLHAGQAAGQLKQWDKSLQLLTRCVKDFPASPHMPEALYEQGWAQQNLDKSAEALALYQQVIAKAPNREVAARAQFMIGEFQFREKNHTEAVNSFFKVVYGYSYPKWQAEATYEAARCLEALQKKDEAAKLYRELLEKFPTSDKAPQAKERLQP